MGGLGGAGKASRESRKTKTMLLGAIPARLMVNLSFPLAEEEPVHEEGKDAS